MVDRNFTYDQKVFILISLLVVWSDKMEFKDVTGTYKCDKCKKSFKANEVVLQPANSNINFPLVRIMVVSEKGIISGCHTPQKGDQTLHCPYCNELHLFGFDKVSEE